MNQIICDACGKVIKNNEQQQANIWTTSTMFTSGIARVNTDICKDCWAKISKRGLTD